MWIIYLKEMLELARDRKTFIFTVFVPCFSNRRTRIRPTPIFLW